MSLFRQRENNTIDRRQSLAGIPILNAGVRYQNEGNGRRVLSAEGPSRVGWMNRFRPPVDRREFELDEFGAYVVERIDGNRSVLDIVNAFQHQFGMSRRESELGVVAFVKMLMQRHLLAVSVSPEAGPGPVPVEEKAR